MNEKHGCACARHLAQGFARQSINAGEGEIYQISLMSALIDGVYEGETTIAELLKHGDFGLGTFNHLDGELIAFDRKYTSCAPTAAPGRPACNSKPLRRRHLFPAQRQPAIRPADHQGATAPVHRRAGRLAEPVLRGAGRRRVQPRGNPHRAAPRAALPPDAGGDRRAADLLVPSAARHAGWFPLAGLHAGHRRGRLSRTLRYRRP